MFVFVVASSLCFYYTNLSQKSQYSHIEYLLGIQNPQIMLAEDHTAFL